MTDLLVSILSILLILSHIIGAILVGKGILKLIKGLKGDGQSTAAVEALKQSLFCILKPMVFASLVILVLLALTYSTQSTIGSWIQLIAPLSTLIWVIWSHLQSRAIQPGEMFETLFPLHGGSTGQALLEQADLWANQDHSLEPKAFVRTILQAIDDHEERQGQKLRLDIDQLVIVMKDTLAEVYSVTKRFPLGKALTLADWIYEGERLNDIWSNGLHDIERGRAFINPYTLLDHKVFWKWSSAQPQNLFEEELATWLHRGVYLIASRRWQNIGKETQKKESTYTNQEMDEKLSDTPLLWRILSRKVAVPFWLYWFLCNVAVILNFGYQVGLVISLFTGGVLYWSLKRVFHISEWRKEFTQLSLESRIRREDFEELHTQSLELLEEARREFSLSFQNTPFSSSLRLFQQTAFDIGYLHRRAEHHLAPLALCNVTIPDVMLTGYLLCDDFSKWRQEGGIFSLILTIADSLGSGVGNIDEKLLARIRQWSNETQHHLDLNPSEDKDDVLTEGELSWKDHARIYDQWLSDKVDQLGFLGSMAIKGSLGLLQNQIKDKIVIEIEKRLIPLYQGNVDSSQANE